MIAPMGNFPGGSAYAMVREISQGYVTVNERTFSRFAKPELDKLGFELDRCLREVRGEQPDLEDIQALQKRNRQIQRLNTALLILRAYRQKKKV